MDKYTNIASTAYLAPVSYYGAIYNCNNLIIDQNEHFIKQTYRNRCNIYGANGLLKLIIPLVYHPEKTPINKIEIDYKSNWQKLHWKSIESAYRSSPYFEYYEHYFSPFYQEQKTNKLIAYNVSLLNLTLKLLKLNPSVILSEEYKKEYNNSVDLRNSIYPKNRNENSALKYKQVFDDKLGFINDLSIIDLLFNLGPDSADYLSKLPKTL